MADSTTFKHLRKRLSRQAVVCGLLTPVFYLLFLAVMNRHFGNEINFARNINGALKFFAAFVFYKNRKLRTRAVPEAEKMMRMEKLVRVLIFSKYLLLIGITGLFFASAKNKSDIASSSAECARENMSHQLEMRFSPNDTALKSIKLTMDGKTRLFRDDLVIRNSEIEKLEDVTGKFGQPLIKVNFTPEGRLKLQKGTGDAIGLSAVTLINGQVASLVTVNDQINDDFVMLGLSRGTSSEGANISYKAQDLCQK